MFFSGPFLLSGASAEGEAARDVEDALAAVGRVRRDLEQACKRGFWWNVNIKMQTQCNVYVWKMFV